MPEVELISLVDVLLAATPAEEGKGNELDPGNPPLSFVPGRVPELLREAALHKLSLLSTIVTKGLCFGLGFENGFCPLGDRVCGEGITTAKGALVVYDEKDEPADGTVLDEDVLV